jgi:hypothetical protein
MIVMLMEMDFVYTVKMPSPRRRGKNNRRKCYDNKRT